MRLTVKRILGPAAMLVCANIASAGMTTVQNDPTEPRLDSIISRVYPTASSSSSSGLTFRRVDDSGTGSDQLWKAGTYSARAVGKFSMYSQTFGTFQSGQFSPLFDVTGGRYSVAGESSSFTVNNNNFAWGRTGNDGHTFTSVDAMNSDGRDHMVTYEVLGGTGAGKTYLLFWEDMKSPGGGRSASDFNDMVLEVRSSGIAVIPLPPAVLTGMATLAGIGGLGLWRRRGTV